MLLLPDDRRVPGVSGVSSSAWIECGLSFVGEEVGSYRALDSVMPSSLNNRGIVRVGRINSRDPRIPT